MKQVFEALDLAIRKADIGVADLRIYGLEYATRLLDVLVRLKTAGFESALIDMDEPLNPVAVRCDDPGLTADRLRNCMLNGRLYFYFDQYEFVGVIAGSIKRGWIRNKVLHTPFFLAPGSLVLTGPSSGNFGDALEWIEMRVRRGHEVFPALLAEHGVPYEFMPSQEPLLQT